MNIDVIIKKGIPVEQINIFEDRVVYNTTITTREYTKSRNAYPYLTGALMRSEVAAPIIKEGNKSYGLASGVDYAKKVWNYSNVNWTNPSTMPQWYYSVLNKNVEIILHNAISKAIKEIK